MKGVNIFLADGFEDIEALAVNDVLRRGGVPVQLVAIGDEPFVTSSHGVTIGVDCLLEDSNTAVEGTGYADVMIFPGGMPGSRNLAACGKLIKAMKSHYAAGGTLAAICAAPGLVLGQLDDLRGIEFTCFDGFEGYLEAKGGVFVPAPAVRSGRIITGRSAGHAISFALEILKQVQNDGGGVQNDGGGVQGDEGDVQGDESTVMLNSFQHLTKKKETLKQVQNDVVERVRNAMFLTTIGQ